MANDFSIRPLELNDEETAALSAELADCHVRLLSAALENYNAPRIKQMRNDFKKGKLTLRYNIAARNAMLKMIALEGKVIAAYSKMCNVLCKAFHRSHLELQATVTLGDYEQEGCMAMYDAQYTYDGSTEFSTYCYWCIRNQLITFTRRHRSEIGVTKKLAAQRTVLRKTMREQNINIDTAVEQLASTGAIKFKESADVKRTMSGNRYFGEKELYEIKDSYVRDDETLLMWDALQKTELTSIERELVEAHLQRKVDFRRIVSETRINPNTGMLYTKAVLSILFLKACAKLKETYTVLQCAA